MDVVRGPWFLAMCHLSIGLSIFTKCQLASPRISEKANEKLQYFYDLPTRDNIISAICCWLHRPVLFNVGETIPKTGIMGEHFGGWLPGLSPARKGTQEWRTKVPNVPVSVLTPDQTDSFCGEYWNLCLRLQAAVVTLSLLWRYCSCLLVITEMPLFQRIFLAGQ